MAGFWEKQVKKYQRGKGIKHKTDNAKRTHKEVAVCQRDKYN